MATFNVYNLRMRKATHEDRLQAIRGQKIPKALGAKVTQRCVIRGIRYHPGFGVELRGLLPEFTRALNAQSIMSNQIPNMDGNHLEEFPYCIWHPQTASEDTYRELARRYPCMKYLVGRACAVAGYVDLFHELDLLPECHIAEEARENRHIAIYDAIMRAEVKYNAMDDYTREIFDPTPGNLNGDTIIRSYLDIRFAIDYYPSLYTGIHWAMFPESVDLTEDGRVDEASNPNEPTEWPFVIKTPFPVSDTEILPLLYNPLPKDLPTLHKDLLILNAAFYGDIDRYVRLRRPVVVHTEQNCVIRGIYNNTVFAKWCSLQTDERLQCTPIIAAINARFIMNGDLSRITADTPDAELPYNIWYPTIPLPCVLEELFRRQPKMKNAIARASILADYESVYDLVDADPDTILMRDACDSTNPHYLQDLEAKVPQRGCKDLRLKSMYNQEPRRKEMFEKPENLLGTCLADRAPHEEWDGISYNGYMANFGHLNLSLSVPESLKAEIPRINGLRLDENYASRAS